VSHAFRGVELRAGDLSIPDDGDALETWNRLYQKLYLLRAELGNVEEETGHVAARPCQSLDPAGPDGIGLKINPDDRHSRLCLHRGTNRVRISGEQHIDPGLEQLIDERREAFEMPLRETVVDGRCSVQAHSPTVVDLARRRRR